MVRKLAVVLAAATALTCAGAARAAPAGFWLNARLGPAASFVAGKPVQVWCAPTAAAMNALNGGLADTQGWTPVIGGAETYLSPLTCAYLDAWLNGRKPSNLYGVAGSMETLAHEAELVRGISDETSATCAGLKAMPRMVTRFFPLKKRESLHDLMGDAYDAWNSQGDLYHAHSC